MAVSNKIIVRHFGDYEKAVKFEKLHLNRELLIFDRLTAMGQLEQNNRKVVFDTGEILIIKQFGITQIAEFYMPGYTPEVEEEDEERDPVIIALGEIELSDDSFVRHSFANYHIEEHLKKTHISAFGENRIDYDGDVTWEEGWGWYGLGTDSPLAWYAHWTNGGNFEPPPYFPIETNFVEIGSWGGFPGEGRTQTWTLTVSDEVEMSYEICNREGDSGWPAYIHTHDPPNKQWSLAPYMPDYQFTRKTERSGFKSVSDRMLNLYETEISAVSGQLVIVWDEGPIKLKQHTLYVMPEDGDIKMCPLYSAIWFVDVKRNAGQTTISWSLDPATTYDINGAHHGSVKTDYEFGEYEETQGAGELYLFGEKYTSLLPQSSWDTPLPAPYVGGSTLNLEVLTARSFDPETNPSGITYSCHNPFYTPDIWKYLVSGYPPGGKSATLDGHDGQGNVAKEDKITIYKFQLWFPDEVAPRDYVVEVEDVYDESCVSQITTQQPLLHYWGYVWKELSDPPDGNLDYNKYVYEDCFLFQDNKLGPFLHDRSSDTQDPLIKVGPGLTFNQRSRVWRYDCLIIRVLAGEWPLRNAGSGSPSDYWYDMKKD